MRSSIFPLLIYSNLVLTATSTANAGNNSSNINNSNIKAVVDHVSMTKEAADIRSQHLLRKKPILQKSVSITSLLFPGAEPVEYTKAPNLNLISGDDDEAGEFIPMWVEYVESRKTPVGVDYYQLPVCPLRDERYSNVISGSNHKGKSKNLGQRLMGHSTKPLGYQIKPILSMGCTILCHVTMDSKQLKLMRRLIEKQYRVHYTLDSLPIIVRSQDLNHALRGYPLGFKMIPQDSKGAEVFLNNHLRFTIYYNEKTSDENDNKIHVTGFDVTPASIRHAPPENGWVAGFQNMSRVGGKDKDGVQEGGGASTSFAMPFLSTCDPSAGPVQNKMDSLLALKTDAAGEDLNVVYSYEVEWKESEIQVSLLVINYRNKMLRQ